MKKKMMKALRDLNAYIDDDRQKLCDRLHILELSHNRKKKALLLIKEYMEKYVSIANQERMTIEVWADLHIYNHVIELCESALFSDGRVNWRIKK